VRFPVAPLKHLAALPISNGVGEAAEFDDPTWPRYVRTTDIAGPRSLRDDTFRSLPPEVAQRAPLKTGDLVMTAAGGVGKSTLYGGTAPACYAGYLVRFRPRPGVDGRFVAYWAESQHYWDQIELGKVVSTIDNFSAGKYQNLRCPAPAEAMQRSIADYLDTETARIDALITKKQQMADVVVERSDLALQTSLARRGIPWPNSLEELEAASSTGECGVIHLSQCLDQLTNGYVGPTRDILVDDGIRYVQSLHIKGGRIDFDRRPFFVTPEWHAQRPRIHLRENDVLIVQTGDIGQVVVVPAGFGEASCHALQIARVRPSVMWGPYLAEYLRSSLGYQSLVSRATGALHPHLEGGIRNVPVLVPSLQVQRDVVSEVSEARGRAAEVFARLERQIDLLREHRQALITAAVTGELEVPGVAA